MLSQMNEENSTHMAFMLQSSITRPPLQLLTPPHLHHPHLPLVRTPRPPRLPHPLHHQHLPHHNHRHLRCSVHFHRQIFPFPASLRGPRLKHRCPCHQTSPPVPQNPPLHSTSM